MDHLELGLFCKSFADDFDRFKNLIDSIDRYNTEKLPFFVSVPESDLELFKPRVSQSSYANLLTDEDLLTQSNALGESRPKDYSGSLLQQIIKVSFGMIRNVSRYVVIDSDSFFIRPFGKKDFLNEDGTPVTIMHKCEDLLGFCEAKGMHFVHTNYKNERIKLQGIFGRTGEIYDFGPTPVVWGSEVWQMLKEDYLDKNNVCLAALILKYPSELLVYGEALLEYKPFPIRPKEPLFKVFHYKEQFEALEEEDKSEATLGKNYLGIVLQSNWNKNAEQLSLTKRLRQFLKKMIILIK